MVGAGTTAQELARRLARVPGLTVVTNSLLVAQALAHANRVEVVMTGGTLRGSNYALVGSGAEQSLHGLRVSRAFLSGAGLTAERGLSTSNMLSASVDRALVQAAAEVVVLADHTKLGTDTMFQTVPTDLITRLVTDEPPGHDERAAMELQALADQGVQITVASSSGTGAGGGSATGPGPRTAEGHRRAASTAGTCRFRASEGATRAPPPRRVPDRGRDSARRTARPAWPTCAAAEPPLRRRCLDRPCPPLRARAGTAATGRAHVPEARPRSSGPVGSRRCPGGVGALPTEGRARYRRRAGRPGGSPSRMPPRSWKAPGTGGRGEPRAAGASGSPASRGP